MFDLGLKGWHEKEREIEGGNGMHEMHFSILPFCDLSSDKFNKN